MKKLFSFFAIVSIVLASNCSRIPENNDPVIGIWSNNLAITNSKAEKIITRFEWIFNDAYLGRYHKIENGRITVTTDFRWVIEDDLYTISYPGMDNKLDDIVIMNESPEGIFLEDTIGNILAIRE